MGQVNQPSNYLDRIKRLERQFQQLWKAIGLTSATIEKGGLTLLNDAFIRMVDDNDDEIVYIGPDDQGKQIISIRREGGSWVLYTYTAVGGLQFWALTDNLGRIIVSDDAESGTGLARPWLPVILYPKFVPATGDDTAGETYSYANLGVTKIAGETELWEGRATISHPFITVDGTWGQASGSNSGTYRLRVNGDVVGTWNTTTLQTAQQGPFDVSAYIGLDFATVKITLSASGTGNIACSPWGCYLRQS